MPVSRVFAAGSCHVSCPPSAHTVRLSRVVVNLEGSKVVVLTDGPKALFVLRVAKEVRVSRLREALAAYSERLQEYL